MLPIRHRVPPMFRCCSSVLFAVAAVPYAGLVLAAIYVADTTRVNASLTIWLDVQPDDRSLRGAMSRATVTGMADTVESGIPRTDPGCVAITGICRPVVNGGSTFDIGRSLTLDRYTQPRAQPNTIPAPGEYNAQRKSKITPNPPVCQSWVL